MKIIEFLSLFTDQNENCRANANDGDYWFKHFSTSINSITYHILSISVSFMKIFHFLEFFLYMCKIISTRKILINLMKVESFPRKIWFHFHTFFTVIKKNIFRSLRNNRTRIHKNLFIAMVIQVLIRLTLYIDQVIYLHA